MMPTRRQLRAGVTAGPAIPARIAQFRAEDWPPTADAPDVLGAAGESVPQLARFSARRRWRSAQRRYAAEHDMTVSELWHLINR